MKSTEKKHIAPPVQREEVQAPKKQSSGDKQFDEAIDRMLKKPVYHAPAK